MNKLLQGAVSAVKGQFTTVPLDDPDDTTEAATASASVAAAPRRAAAPPPPPPPPPTSSAAAAASAAPTHSREVAPPTPGNTAAGAAAAADAGAASASPVVNMMSRLSGIFGRGVESGNVKESAGLLTPDADLEAGNAIAEGGGDASAAGAAAAAPAAGLLGSWFGSQAPAGGTVGEDATAASAPAAEAGGGIGSWLNPMSILKTREKNMWDKICPEVSRANRLTGFFVLAGLSALFFLLAFFVGLPMVLLAPAKFALSFTVGSLCFMLAFAVLEGPASYFTNNCSRERLPFAAAYFLSLLATLYVSFFGKGYLLTVLTASVQVVALAWYGSTYFPGGQAAMKFVASMGWGAAKSVMALAMNCFNKE